MRLTHNGDFVRTDRWREGEYFDLWSVPHFLSGIALGLFLIFFEFDFRSAFVIGLILLVIYEMFEVIVEIHETRWNRTLDVVVGMASLTPTIWFAPTFPVVQIVWAFAVVMILDATLSFFGWRASQKAAILERRLRAEYAQNVARMRLRNEKLRQKWGARRRFRPWRKPLEHGIENGQNAEDGA